eukprot:CAMPEP_0117751904 /NCGR_PEP_ID=MMETSP0947-20121206/11265_1 /TAXON_ID=44440 /ORGANISM="Chattonella subsalsa, Strain CCMP2191" /LENGTH=335 /DNA_ID=CAMNT_0005570399 /DNA_START=4 /DNA_END=1011 /DNA_ORIENTATION=+
MSWHLQAFLLKSLSILAILSGCFCYQQCSFSDASNYNPIVCSPKKLFQSNSNISNFLKISRQNGCSKTLDIGERKYLHLSRRKLASNDEEKSPQNLKGYYVRPSAALERGGGFFVPGLEGGRLQLLVAALALVLLAVNRYPGYDVVPSQLTSEVLGVVAAVAALAQFLFQGLAASNAAADAQSVQDEDVFKLSPDLEFESALAEKVVWSAASLLEATPRATLMLLLSAKESGENAEALLACIGRRQLQNEEFTTDEVAALIDQIKDEGGFYVGQNTGTESPNASIFSRFPSSWKTCCGQVVDDSKVLLVLSEAYIKLGEKDKSFFSQVASLLSQN